MEIMPFVNSIFSSNTYLIKNDYSQSCYLIDCGDVDLFSYILQQEKLNLQGVFVTHTHLDHIYGLNMLCEIYPDIVIYTSDHGKEGLYSDKLNLSKYQTESFILQTHNVEIVQDGQEILLFDSEVLLKVYETPGHDWSSLCYKVGNIVFTGDSYLPQYNLVANFPKSDMNEALKSLKKIEYFSAGCSIYPGHGDIVHA